MNLTELFSVLLVFLHCNLGISCVKITLNGFEVDCVREPNCKITAATLFNVTGSIDMPAGGDVPEFLRYDHHCPPSTQCLIYHGNGSWRSFWGVPFEDCGVNFKDDFSGCYRVADGKYEFYLQLGPYYHTRWCRYRALLCYKKNGAISCGPVSNELPVTDLIKNVPNYGYDNRDDEEYRLMEKECYEEKRRASENGKEEARHPSDDLLVTFGVVLAINMIVF